MWNEYEIITPFSLSNSYSFSLFSGYCWKHLVCVSVHSLQGGLLINHHADQSLNSFCQWQSALVGKNGKRHDHAILLTGFDICSWKNEPCDTLGMHQNTGWQTWGCPQHELSWFQIKVHFAHTVCLLEEDGTVLFLDCHLFKEYFWFWEYFWGNLFIFFLWLLAFFEWDSSLIWEQ